MKELVPDRELCEELFGLKKLDTMFDWLIVGTDPDHDGWFIGDSCAYPEAHIKEYYPAPTLGEMVRLLPDKIFDNQRKNCTLDFTKKEGIYQATYRDINKIWAIALYNDAKPENAVIKMLIYLYKEGFI